LITLHLQFYQFDNNDRIITMQRQRDWDWKEALEAQLGQEQTDGISATRHLEPEIALPLLLQIHQKERRFVLRSVIARWLLVPLAVSLGVILLLLTCSLMLFGYVGNGFWEGEFLQKLFTTSATKSVERRPRWKNSLVAVLHHTRVASDALALPALLTLAIQCDRPKFLLTKALQADLYFQLTARLTRASRVQFQGLSTEQLAYLQRIVKRLWGRDAYPRELASAVILVLGLANRSDTSVTKSLVQLAEHHPKEHIRAAALAAITDK
jgi:hypothetical protein